MPRPLSLGFLAKSLWQVLWAASECKVKCESLMKVCLKHLVGLVVFLLLAVLTCFKQYLGQCPLRENGAHLKYILVSTASSW